MFKKQLKAAIEKVDRNFREGEGVEKSEEHSRSYEGYLSWLEKEQAEIELNESA